MSTVVRTETSTSTTTTLVQNIRFKEKIGYGLGDLASNFVFTAII